MKMATYFSEKFGSDLDYNRERQDLWLMVSILVDKLGGEVRLDNFFAVSYDPSAPRLVLSSYIDQVTGDLVLATRKGMLPCPFCGSHDVHDGTDGVSPYPWRVKCENCGASVTRPRRAEAILAWETRVQIPKGDV